MEKQKSVFARFVDWMRERFSRQEVQGPYEPAVFERVIDSDQETDSYMLTELGITDNIKLLATDIEKYLSTYASPPFGYSDIPGQRNQEEWIKTIAIDIKNNEDWFGMYRNLIGDSICNDSGVLEDLLSKMNSQSASQISQRLDQIMAETRELLKQFDSEEWEGLMAPSEDEKEKTIPLVEEPVPKPELLPEDKDILSALEAEMDENAEWLSEYTMEASYSEDYEYNKKYMYPAIDAGREKAAQLRAKYEETLKQATERASLNHKDKPDEKEKTIHLVEEPVPKPELLPEDKEILSALEAEMDENAEWLSEYTMEASYSEDYKHKKKYMYPAIDAGREKAAQLRAKYEETLKQATERASLNHKDKPDLKLDPRNLSYPLSNLSNDGCLYAKVALDRQLFQALFGEEQINKCDTHDAYLRYEDGEFSKFLRDKLTKDIICDSPVVEISQDSLIACGNAMEFMEMYVNSDLTSIVSDGNSKDCTLKAGLRDYFMKSEQCLVMCTSKEPWSEREDFIVLNEEKQLDIPSIQKTISDLYNENAIRGILAGIADLPGIQVNDPYNILGRDIYLSQYEIRNQFIRNAYIPSDNMINSMESLNTIVGFNCSIDDVKKFSKGEIPEGSCLRKIPDEAKKLVDEVKSELDAKDAMKIKEPMPQHDLLIGIDVAL